MVDQNVGPAQFPFGVGTAPQVPHFPNPELRDAADAASDACLKLEQDYGSLRVVKEKAFPSLAMYSYNEDGGAAGRPDDLPTWGPWADSRMKDKVWSELRQRVTRPASRSTLRWWLTVGWLLAMGSCSQSRFRSI